MFPCGWLPLKWSAIGLVFNGAETTWISHILSIRLMISYRFAFFFQRHRSSVCTVYICNNRKRCAKRCSERSSCTVFCWANVFSLQNVSENWQTLWKCFVIFCWLGFKSTNILSNEWEMWLYKQHVFEKSCNKALFQSDVSFVLQDLVQSWDGKPIAKEWTRVKCNSWWRFKQYPAQSAPFSIPCWWPA